MKKLFALLLLMIFFLAACSGVQSLSSGDYIYSDSGEPLYPILSLESGNKFSFTYSVLSSYIAYGSYELSGDELLLKTSDGKYEYRFRVDGKTLIFNAEESSELPDYTDVPDGAVFK